MSLITSCCSNSTTRKRALSLLELHFSESLQKQKGCCALARQTLTIGSQVTNLTLLSQVVQYQEVHMLTLGVPVAYRR